MCGGKQRTDKHSYQVYSVEEIQSAIFLADDDTIYDHLLSADWIRWCEQQTHDAISLYAKDHDYPTLKRFIYFRAVAIKQALELQQMEATPNVPNRDNDVASPRGRR